MKKLKSQKGFTLIELMIAMSIFVIFMGILINSYTNVVRSQREANDYRALYSEGRAVFGQIVDEVRNGVIYYPVQGNVNVGNLIVLSKDAMAATVFCRESESVRLEKWEKQSENGDFFRKETYRLNEETLISDFEVNVVPVYDPYLEKYAGADALQFQPEVWMKAVFEKELTSGKVFDFALQTAVSSRFYSAAPIVATDQFCSPF